MKIDTTKKFIIGMIHLLPLKEQEGRSLQELLQHAQKEANFLIEGGVDAICLINESDKPRDITIGEYEKERFTKIAVELRQITDIPLGICVLYNDRKATFEIAKTSHADFVRIDTFIDDVMSDAGVITAYPEKIIAMKDELCSDIQLFVDIHPKYKNLISYRPLEESVKEAFTYPIDWVIITGNQTGEAALISDVIALREAFPLKTIIAGSGIDTENCSEYYPYINGAFIGAGLKSSEGEISLEKIKRIKESL